MSVALIWIILGFVLILAEFALTSFVVIFFGLSALLVGMLLWAGLPTTHGLHYLLFAGLSVGLLLLTRSRFQSWFMGGTITTDADEDFLGHEAEVSSGFNGASPGRGRVSFRGADWDARSTTEEFKHGSITRIVGRNSMILTIEPIED